MGSLILDINGDDRISTFPDHILLHILSFLPTKHSVATTILSKRWNLLWTSVPVLHFHSSLLYSHKPQPGSFFSFLKRLITSSPQNSHLPLIERFTVIQDARVRYIFFHDLISFVLRRGVKTLELGELELRKVHDHFKDQVLYKPISFLDLCGCELFTCTTLVILKLGCVVDVDELGNDFGSSIKLPNLRVLHISLKYPSVAVAQNLFCGCFFPLLEELSVNVCIGSKEEEEENVEDKTLKIISRTLKKLHICLVSSRGKMLPCCLVIDAPFVEDFKFWQQIVESRFVIEDLRSVTRASIRVDSNQCVLDLLRGIYNNVRTLSLSRDARISDPQHLPVFHRLIHFKSRRVSSLKDLNVLAMMLSCSPNLEHLAISYSHMYFYSSGKLHVLPTWVHADFMLLRLKEVEIKHCLGLDVELEVIRYLLKEGKVLNKMEITVNGGINWKHCVVQMHPNTKKVWSEKIFNFPKNSESCSIDFS